MKTRKLVILLSVLFAICMFAGCGAKEKTTSKKEEVRTFADWTEAELFQDIPAMLVENGRITDAGDEGGSNYIMTVNGSEMSDYTAYLELLQANGFTKHSDGGADGINKNVYSTTFTKDTLVLTVIYMEKTNLTYIIAEEKLALSEHLIDNEVFRADNKAGAQTTLHMVGLDDYGNSFVIQMKNGHFIVCDGARSRDLPYLIEYLESLTPGDEKPVIEAWMVSHPHGDHAGVFTAINDNWTYAERIYVEGIYMDIINNRIATEQEVAGVQLDTRTAASNLYTTSGEHPKVYRPQAGQKYYFSDIVIDVMQTMAQCPKDNWYRWNGNVNEYSTWLMFNIDGQKFLNAGDADYGSMRAVMRSYDAEYLEMDIMAVQHHGINVHNDFSDFITVKTLLYPNFGIYGSFEEGQSWGGSWQASVYRNEYLQEGVLESLSYLDGTQVLTFPYEVGTAKSLGKNRDYVDVSDDPTRIQYY